MTRNTRGISALFSGNQVPCAVAYSGSRSFIPTRFRKPGLFMQHFVLQSLHCSKYQSSSLRSKICFRGYCFGRNRMEKLQQQQENVVVFVDDVGGVKEEDSCVGVVVGDEEVFPVDAPVGSKIVVVFDFDLTIINCDSDPWVMEKLGVSQLFESLLTTFPWNSAMDKMMGELHDQGKTIADIEKAAKTVPLYPATVRAIKRLHSLGCDLRIVSDANMFFIKTILAHHGLLQCFTEIKTNPAIVEENGRLRIKPYHPFTTGPPHGCPLCPPNMCKGMIIEELRNLLDDKKFFYLGDGSGDFCPSSKLRADDCVLPRKEYPLWNLVQMNQETVKAQVHEWSDAQDMENLLSTLIA